jgi:hypothetical protein
MRIHMAIVMYTVRLTHAKTREDVNNTQTRPAMRRDTACDTVDRYRLLAHTKENTTALVRT